MVGGFTLQVGALEVLSKAVRICQPGSMQAEQIARAVAVAARRWQDLGPRKHASLARWQEGLISCIQGLLDHNLGVSLKTCTPLDDPGFSEQQLLKLGPDWIQGLQTERPGKVLIAW